MQNGLQMGCFTLGILCFLYYIVIVLYAGITADFAWIWVTGGIFFLLLGQGLRCVMRHPDTWLRWPLRAGITLAVIAFGVVLYLGGHIVGAMCEKQEQNLDYVIVLGAQVRGETVSRALRKRLDCAAAYAQKNPDTVFFLSGGKGSGEDITEAEAMRRYLEERGIDAERLILEDRSTSTKENLEFCNALLEIRDKRVGVLSNDFHVYRAGALAKKQGYQNVFRISAKSDWIMEPHYVVREICAVLVSTLRGEMTV